MAFVKKVLLVLFLAQAVAIGVALFTQWTQAPEVRFTLLSGESLATSELRGRVLLVNFWSTSCAPCMKEMPKMVETYRRFAPRGHDLIAVAVRRDAPERVSEFTAERALPFRVALDGDGAVAEGFGNVRVTPSTFVIDREGRIRKRYVGAPDWSELHALLERL